MNVQQLRYLQSIVVTGSFGAAAKACQVSQSAITQAMQALEREWGCALFERSGRQKLPTPAAQSAVQQMGRLVNPLDELMRSGPEPSSDHLQRPVLRVGMAPAAGFFYGPLIQSTWSGFEPDGLLQILSGGTVQLLQAFRLGELDLLIGPRPRGAQVAGVHRYRVHQSMLSVCARKSHPLRRATTLAELAGAGWGVAGSEGTPDNAVEEAHRVRKLHPPRVLVECADYTMLLRLVAHSDLLCMVPHPVLLRGREELAIQLLRVTDGLPLYEVFLYWRPPAMQALQSAQQRVVDVLTHAAATAARHEPA